MRKRIRWNGLLVAIALVAWDAPGARAEVQRVVLKDGSQVVGDVLAEKPDAIFVDIGFDVIRVPLDAISPRLRADRS